MFITFKMFFVFEKRGDCFTCCHFSISKSVKKKIFIIKLNKKKDLVSEITKN